MFERFTERARAAVTFAQEESRALQQSYIGTEHILLGLLREEEGVAAQCLRAYAIECEDVRAFITSIIAVGDKTSPSNLPFTTRAKKALELSLRESLSLGCNYIGTEHLLLGLLRAGDSDIGDADVTYYGGFALRVLSQYQIDLDTLRESVLERIHSRSEELEKRELPNKTNEQYDILASLFENPSNIRRLQSEIKRTGAKRARALARSDFERAISHNHRLQDLEALIPLLIDKEMKNIRAQAATALSNHGTFQDQALHQRLRALAAFRRELSK